MPAAYCGGVLCINKSAVVRDFSVKNQDKFSSWVFESQGEPVVEELLLPGLLLMLLSLGGNG